MQLGYVIVYVDDVVEAIQFYESAFGLKRAFVHEEGQFGQLDTGGTALAFTSHQLGSQAVPVPYTALRQQDPPVGVELTMLTADVDEAFGSAVAAGAVPLSEPHDEPWGQRVSYVRDPFGTLVGIATPMS